MNKFFVLALIVVTMNAQCQAANPFAGITTLKNRVKSTSSDLTRYGNNLIFNTRQKLNNLKLNQMQNVNSAVNKALEDIRKDVTAAKNEGKDAEHCYESARLQLRDTSNTAFSKLEKCVDSELDSLNPVKSNIDAHINNGKLLLSELDGIAISCSSGTPIQAQLCVGQKLPAASLSVSAYESTAKELKSTGDSIANSAPASVIRCFQSPMSDLYSSVASTRSSAAQCISSS